MRSDDGFTLIELLIVIVILGVITAAIAASIITGLRQTKGVQDRISESHDMELLSTYLVPDIESSSAFVATCGFPPAGSTTVLALHWTDPGANPSVSDDLSRDVVYRVVGSGSSRRLLRYACVAGSEEAHSPIVVAHGLSDQNPVVSCVPASPCTPASTEVAVSVQLCSRDTANACLPAPNTFDVSVSASRRAP